MNSYLLLLSFKKRMFIRVTRETSTRVQRIQAQTWRTEDHIFVDWAGKKGRGRSLATAAPADACFSKKIKKLLVRKNKSYPKEN